MTTWLINNLVTVVDGLAFGVLLFVIALGLSLVFGVMDVLNLAHGALYMVGAYVAVSLVEAAPCRWPPFSARRWSPPSSAASRAGAWQRWSGRSPSGGISTRPC